MISRALSWSTILLATAAAPAVAQLISIRTVPISQAHQFDLFPSSGMAMGGVALAVDDSLYDPFGNPATGVRLGLSRFWGSPGVYSVSNGAGAGRSLPLGTWIRSGNWFGGAALAVQQVDLSQRANPIPIPLLCPACDSRLTAQFPDDDDRSHSNAFGYAMVGLLLPNAGLSFAGSAMWSDLHGVDGVDLLYPGSARLKQDGHAFDVRVGALKQWEPRRALSAVMVYNQFASTHDVFYLDGFWDPGSQQFSTRPRLEENLDHTNTWGLQFEYTHPLSAPGWRMGWVATTNLMSHPKIPNYAIQNIPRDPGNSQAFNLGAGISRSDQSSTFALDLIYEPIWSYTWADAAEPIETDDGTTIPAGGKTIENRFHFSNAVLRMGFAQDLPFDKGTKGVALRLGLQVHSIDYSMVQDDNVQITTRHQDEAWVEWTPTWGLSLRFPAWEIHYRGSVTNGTGRPGVSSGGDVVFAEPANGVILVAPSGPLTLNGVKVMTHQVAVTFPFR
jgi:hypothetical protein